MLFRSHIAEQVAAVLLLNLLIFAWCRPSDFTFLESLRIFDACLHICAHRHTAHRNDVKSSAFFIETVAEDSSILEYKSIIFGLIREQIN